MGDLQSGVNSALEGDSNFACPPFGVADLLISGEEPYGVKVLEEAEGDGIPKVSWLLMNIPVLLSGLGEAERTASYVGGII